MIVLELWILREDVDRMVEVELGHGDRRKMEEGWGCWDCSFEKEGNEYEAIHYK